MLDWIENHKEIIIVFTNIATLLVWLVYAQLLYLGFRRQRSPRLIINRGRNKDINALCIISNMSAESIFIQYIIVELETSEGKIIMDVTDLEQAYNQGDEHKQRQQSSHASTATTPAKLYENTRQGPIRPGEFLHIGTFNGLLQRIARDEDIAMDGSIPKGELEFNRLTLRLIGFYGPDNLPIGAERSFELSNGGDNRECTLKPESWNARQLSSFWQRRKLRKTVEQLNNTNFITSSSFRHIDQGDSEENRAAAEQASKRG